MRKTIDDVETLLSYCKTNDGRKIDIFLFRRSLNHREMTSNPNYRFHPTSSSLEPEEPSSDIQFSLWHTFKSHIPRFLLTILFDIILPLILFLLLQKRIKSVYALLIAGTPPLVMIFFKAILSRTFDALGFLVFISFLISAIVAVVTHNDIILLLEKSIATAIISFIFAITLIPFRCCSHRCRWRPLAYYFYQDLIPTKRAQVGLPDGLFYDRQEPINEQEEREVSIPDLSHKEEVAQVYEWIYVHCPSFRLSCYIITGIWSTGFIFEFLSRLILILIHLSVNRIVIYGHIILSFITVLCITLTIICIVKERKQTLASIKQWKAKYLAAQQQPRQVDLPIWTVTDNLNTIHMVNQTNRY